MKNIKQLILTIVFVFIAVVVFFCWVIFGSFKQMGDKECDAIKSLHFTGTIIEVDTYDYIDYMHDNFLGIKIVRDDNTVEDIQFNLGKNPELASFVAVNQKVKKVFNQTTISITDSLHKTKTFKLGKNDCE